MTQGFVGPECPFCPHPMIIPNQLFLSWTISSQAPYFSSGLAWGQGKYHLHGEGREGKEACMLSLSLITGSDMSCADVVFRYPIHTPLCRHTVFTGYRMLFISLLVLSDLERHYLQSLQPPYPSYSHLHNHCSLTLLSLLRFPACSMDIIARPAAESQLGCWSLDASYSFSQQWRRKKGRKKNGGVGVCEACVYLHLSGQRVLFC